MANVIKLKNSGTANSAPSSLEAGELAINYADGKIYYKNSSNVIVQIATIQANSVTLGTQTVGNYMSNVSAGTGITVTHTPGEGSTATIAVTANTYQPLDADLTAIAALSGTSGVLKKTAANTWELDTATYLTSASTLLMDIQVMQAMEAY